MAWKNFQNGYPLYASELNNYLMSQSVATFASSAERASVLTAPLEGQVTWLQDTNAFQVYNGSAWVDINDNTDAIQKSLLTTAGDTIYATGASTPARLGIGSSGSLMKSTGSAPTWLAPGTSGQVLYSTGTDLSWTTITAGGGYTLLQSFTPTTSTSWGMSDYISAGYKDVYIEMQNLRASTASAISVGVSGNIRAIQSKYSSVTNVTATSIFGVTIRPNAVQDASFMVRIGNITYNRRTNPTPTNYPFTAQGGWHDNAGNAPDSMTSSGSIYGDFFRVDFNFSTALSGGTINIYGAK